MSPTKYCHVNEMVWRHWRRQCDDQPTIRHYVKMVLVNLYTELKMNIYTNSWKLIFMCFKVKLNDVVVDLLVLGDYVHALSTVQVLMEL